MPNIVDVFILLSLGAAAGFFIGWLLGTRNSRLGEEALKVKKQLLKAQARKAA